MKVEIDFTNRTLEFYENYTVKEIQDILEKVKPVCDDLEEWQIIMVDLPKEEPNWPFYQDGTITISNPRPPFNPGL